MSKSQPQFWLMEPQSHVLVLGAGFSVPIGGPTSRELSARLASFQYDLSEAARAALLQGEDYEDALNLLSAMGADEARHQLLETIRLEFHEIDKRMRTLLSRKEGFVRHIPIFLNRVIDRLPPSGRGYTIITTNQDLAIERIWANRKLYGVHTKQNSEAGCMSLACVGQVDDSYGMEQEPPKLVLPHDGEICDLATPGWNFYKIHGSFNWVDTNGSAVLVTGQGKDTQCRSVPVLKAMLERLDKLLLTPRLKILSIGYSFRDAHLNNLLSGAIRQGGRITVVAPDSKEICLRLWKSGWNARAVTYIPSTTEAVFSYLYGSGGYKEMGSSWAGKEVSQWTD